MSFPFLLCHSRENGNLSFFSYPSPLDSRFRGNDRGGVSFTFFAIPYSIFWLLDSILSTEYEFIRPVYFEKFSGGFDELNPYIYRRDACIFFTIRSTLYAIFYSVFFFPNYTLHAIFSSFSCDQIISYISQCFRFMIECF
jgi:hypothetical protein